MDRNSAPHICTAHTLSIEPCPPPCFFLILETSLLFITACACTYADSNRRTQWLSALLSPFCGLRGGQTRVARLAQSPLYLLSHLPSPLSVVFIKVEEGRETEPGDTGELTLDRPPCLLFSLHTAMARDEHSGSPCGLVEPHPRFLRCSEVWVN